MRHPTAGVRNLEKGVDSEGMGRLNTPMTDMNQPPLKVEMKREMNFKMVTGKNSRE